MIGKKIGGRYEILDRVGGGGMAVVYKAKDVWLDRVVALKVLRPQYAIDDDFVQRFRREAQAAGSLSHSNIVSIYDVGIEEDVHYIVMEYVEGSTLKEYITNHAPLSAHEAVQITKQIADALEHAHHNQIIHRDIKPHNILVGKNLRIKVTDFGIARAVTSATITHTGSVIGSVHYFSPEQARGGITGEKSDIYSLGIVLYEMLTGKLPFGGDSPISVALKHLQESYTEPRQLNPSIPQSVENIIIRCLAKDPMYRYDSAKDLMQDLDTCLDVSRQNEEKLIIDEDLDNEENTKVIPALTEDMFETKVAPQRRSSKPVKAAELVEDDDDDEDEDDELAPKRKRSIWIKLGIAFAIILLLGFGVYQGANSLLKLFYVKEIELKDVTDLPYDEAVEILEEQGFKIATPDKVHDPDIEEGHVVSQQPAGKSMAKENSYVKLTVSLGREKVRMKNVVDYHVDSAKSILERNNFHIDNVDVIEEEHDTIRVGHVIRQEPDVDEWVIPEETNVKLYVSKGKARVSMPSLLGKTREEAESEITKQHLVLEEVLEDFSDDYPAGQVFRQFPADPEVEVEKGTPIKIWVSKGFKEVYREKAYAVNMELEENEMAIITIFVDDENGEGERTVVQEQIYESKEYTINVKVSREKSATIKVYKNGSLVNDAIRINFED